jgi:ribosomal protein S18 acetylase RimI-like enzyme
VRLAAHHPVEQFTCGSRSGAAEIDDYLKSSALREQDAGLSAVWVTVNRSESNAPSAIAGYFTLSPLSVPLSSVLLERVGLSEAPYRSIGGYLLGRLGVAVQLQRKNIGAALVAAAIRIAREARDEAGGAFLAVDPKNDSLARWYEQLDFGFRRLAPERRRMVLRL